MRLAAVALLTLLAVAGCAQRQALFVVLPGEDGHVGAITVDDGKTRVVLDSAYAAEEIRGGTAAPASVKPDEVDQVFAAALAARPILPRHFRLYFVVDSDRLVPESEAAYREVFDELKRRPVFEVEVVGYTDTLGPRDRNQRLSLLRAIAIRDRLAQDRPPQAPTLVPVA